jgi:hypothetical protein
MNKFDSLYEGLLNGVSKGMSIEDIAKKHDVDLEELKIEWDKGTKVETEHTTEEGKEPTSEEIELAKKIAKDHLFEDPKYYTKLAEIEKK